MGLYFLNLSKGNEAAQNISKAKELSQELYSKDNPHLAKVNNLEGDLFAATGNHTKADSLYKVAYQSRLNYYPNIHIDVAESLNNIGSMLWKI